MALIWIWDVALFIFFAGTLYYSIILLLNIPFIFLPEIEYNSNIYLDDSNNIEGIPNNIKSKTTTKMRWAKRTQQRDDSFANAVMWGDLGND